MQKKQIIEIFLLTGLFFVMFNNSLVHASRQNLDEVMTRKSRYTINTFYSAESEAPYYFWQPETLMYIDANYGTEVWRVVFKPGNSDIFSKEYSNQAFNSNGGKIGIWSTAAYTNPNKRVSGDPNKYVSDGGRWIANTDGTKLRVTTSGGLSNDNSGFNWMNTQSAYLFTPYSTSDPVEAKLGQVFKVQVDENNTTSRQLIYDTDDGRRKNITFKDSLTSNDKWLVMQDQDEAAWPTPLAINSYRISFLNLVTHTIDYQWGAARGVGPNGTDDLYGATTPTNQIYFRGSSTFVIGQNAETILGNYYNVSPFWQMKKSGSASDGGPAWEDWDGDSFGNDEIKALSDNSSLSVETPHNPYDNGYAGHQATDRWGHYVSIGSSQDCDHIVYGSSPTRYVRWGNNGCPGRLILDMSNNLSNPPWYDANNTNYMAGSGVSGTYVGGQHASWTGWSDYTVFVASINTYSTVIPSTSESAAVIWQNQYNKTSQLGKSNTQAPIPLVSTELVYFDTYSAYPRPSQSPDGTKVAFSTIMFNSPYAGIASDDDFSSTAFVVAYYPYPPEIKSAAKNGSNVRLTWDFNQGTNDNPNHINPRTYTKRGWPNETTDRPPSPREIKQFRVWESSDNAAWSPLGTTDYNNCSGANECGTWTQTSWNYDINQANNTTKYYAITSIEHSGLESRTLSNVWKVITDGSGNIISQTQQSDYPADPGYKTNFFAIKPNAPSSVVFVHQQSPAIVAGQYTITWNAPANKSLIRYYNIYAKDGVAPSTIQQNRIASISATVDYTNSGSYKYVDWLGNTNGSTQYFVTAVDFQGNESDAYNSQPAPLAGDLNSDGKVDNLDIQACVDHILGTQDYGAKADVNQDGSVNVIDVQRIVNVILGE